jgi:glycosyltransferase involved in cell wall biosynthesis
VNQNLKLKKESIVRVVHLAKYHSPHYGGMESHVETLSQKQAQLGAEVCIVCVNSFDRKMQLSQRTKTEITFDENHVQVIKVGRYFSFLKLDFCPSLILYVLYFSKLPNTIFHVHTPNPTMLIALVLAGKIRNMAITHHSDAIKQRLLKYLFRPIEHLIYRQAAIVLTTSKAYQKGSKFLRLYSKNLGVLPLGSELSAFTNPHPSILERAQKLKAEHGDILWVAVGRLVYYKSFHIALAALRDVPGKLAIVGTGKLMADLQKTAQELGVADRIIWWGRASTADLIAAYHAATALWFPSNIRSEAFGMVQVEAMASGCPAINCDIPGSGVPWVCRHEREGLTVPINDARAFGAAARRLLEEPGLHDRLSQGARQRALKFSDELMAERSLAIYQKILQRQQSKKSLLLTPSLEREVSLASAAIELEISEDLTPSTSNGQHRVDRSGYENR